MPESESSTREETAVVDRRMTLIPEEPEPGRTNFTLNFWYYLLL